MDHVPSEHEHDADVGGGDGRFLLSRRRHLFFAGLCLLLSVGFLALGVWQVERRAWKLSLIARVEAGTRAPPAPLPPPAVWPSLEPRTFEYRRIQVTGVFQHRQETLVQALTAHGAGWWLLTPLRTSQGIVLVNRGFVPQERRDPATREEGQLRGSVTITGLMRTSEPDGGLLRSNDPASEHWYSRDVAAIGQARSLATLAPFFIDADASPNPSGYPIGGLTVLRFRNNHLAYAITWFMLSALSIAGAVIVLRTPERR